MLYLRTVQRDALKGRHFVIKCENETNIMLQYYLSFLSDQKKKRTPFRETV